MAARMATGGPTVCLVSSHPLVLEEFREWLADSGIQPQTHRLDTALLSAPGGPDLPPASIYVVDGHGPRPVTESVVASILARHQTSRLLVLAHTGVAFSFISDFRWDSGGKIEKLFRPALENHEREELMSVVGAAGEVL